MNKTNESRGFAETGLLYLWWLIQQSMVYKILTTTYSAVSAQWRDSTITSAFRKEETGEFMKNSLWCRLISKIPSFAKNKRLAEATESCIQESIFIKSASYLLHNILALNLKFIGWLLSVAVGLNIILTVISSRSFPSILSGAVLIIGFILSRIDVNVMSFFSESGLVKFIEYTLHCEFNFDFYYKTRTKGESRIMCAMFFGIIAGVISYFISPFMAAVFILGLAFVFMVLYKTMTGVFFTVLLAPIVPTMVMAGLCLLTLVSFMIKVITTRNFEWKFDFTSFLIVNLVAILFISAAISFVPMISLRIFLIYAAFISFYFVMINMVENRKQFYALLVTFVVSGALVSLYGLMQYYFNVGITQAWTDEEMFATIGTRVFSTLENPNVLGTYLLLVIPVTIALMWSSKRWLTKIVFTGIVGIMFVTLLLTYSRGCWIAIMIAAAMYITFVKGKLWGLALLAIPFVPMILTLLPANVVERLTSIGNLEDTSSNYRMNIWLGSLTMIRDWWVSGIGLGTDAFMQVYPFYAFSAAFASHSHNLYMQILVENGIVGFLLFATVIVFAMKSLSRAWHLSPANPVTGKKGALTDKLSVMPVAIGAALIGFLMQGVFDHALYNYRVFLMFWIVIGFATLCKFVAKEKTATKGEVAVA